MCYDTFGFSHLNRIIILYCRSTSIAIDSCIIDYDHPRTGNKYEAMANAKQRCDVLQQRYGHVRNSYTPWSHHLMCGTPTHTMATLSHVWNSYTPWSHHLMCGTPIHHGHINSSIFWRGTTNCLVFMSAEFVCSYSECSRLNRKFRKNLPREERQSAYVLNILLFSFVGLDSMIKNNSSQSKGHINSNL